ncbi:MAG: hypothetical protein WBE34_17745 [Candidatus Nitrosopolaris sp.]
MSIESLLVSAFMSSKVVITETGYQNIYSGCKTMHENNIVSVIIVRKNAASLTQHQQQEEEEYDPSSAGVVASTRNPNNTNNKTENGSNPRSVGRNNVP